MAEAIGRISRDEVRSLAEGVVTRETRESRSSRDGNIDPSSPRPSIHQDDPIETRLSSVSTHPHPQLFYPEIGPGESHTPLRHVLRPEFIANLSGVTTPHASLNWSLTFSTTHIVVLSMLLGLASKPGSARPILGEADGLSTAEGKSQWEACQRPLGAWDVVWAVKAAVGMGMATWDYRFMTRPREIRARRPGERRWYFRCAYFLEICGLVWFVVANILLYSSRGTCRFTSPYIWWLTFELVCWGYLVAVEIIVEALVRGSWMIGDMIIGRVLWNSGRRSTQRARQAHFGSGVPPIPRAWVDRIPLAVYIPTVVQGQTKSPLPATDGNNEKHTPPPVRTWLKFFFFSRRRKVEGDPEAIWQKTEHPFVRLEPSLAVCAICQVDFEPPRRVGVEHGPEPEALRLLKCGHVFHRECVGPWLYEVSGRCPTCQRRVEHKDLEPEEQTSWFGGSNWDVRTWFRIRLPMRC